MAEIGSSRGRTMATGSMFGSYPAVVACTAVIMVIVLLLVSTIRPLGWPEFGSAILSTLALAKLAQLSMRVDVQDSGIVLTLFSQQLKYDWSEIGGLEQHRLGVVMVLKEPDPRGLIHARKHRILYFDPHWTRHQVGQALLHRIVSETNANSGLVP